MAGGGGAPIPEKGGKKGVDFVVNLIPTIDLMSVLIAFLLITAVWTQIARIDTEQALSNSAAASTDAPKDDIEILLREGELFVALSTSHQKERLELTKGSAYLKELRGILTRLKTRAAEAPKVMLAAEDAIVFSRMIEVMDLCVDLGLGRIVVTSPTSLRAARL